MNKDLRTLHTMLVERVLALSKALGKATDEETANSIANEIQEFNHRVNVLNGLLFAKATARISAKVKAVKDASIEIDTAINSVSRLSEFLKGCNSFLRLVDSVIKSAQPIV